MRNAAIATGLALGLLGAGPAGAATYGLVVGINDYAGVSNDLEGAVADAQDIAHALIASGAADVALLTDRGATKAVIEAAWFAIVDQAEAGDTIVFSYAGHGAQEPEPEGRGGETDGLNETFVLGGYSSIGPAAAERIIDDEIFAWLQAADEKGISVIFLADSCHSGTMYRAVGGLRYRLGDFDPPAEDPVELPPVSFAVTTEDDFENVTFVGATQEDRLTPELMIDGVRRGALSWAFARALEGAADLDRNGSLTQQELIAYLVPAVEMQAQNQQRPSVIPISGQSKPLLVIGAGTASADVAVPEVLLRVYVPDASALPAIDGVGLVLDPAEADLVWDPATGTVTHNVAGTVAENIDADSLPAVVAKWAALALLQRYATLAPFDMTLEEGNAIHHRGEVLTITLSGGTARHLTLVNIAPNGRVEYLRPLNMNEQAMDWRGVTAIERLQVADPPYGAEHLVAILTEEQPEALRAGLRALAGDNGSAGLVALLRTVLGDEDAQVGILGIYTAE